MMAPMEKQVCSLEHSQKLEKLGVKQNSLFYWRKYQFCKNTDLYYIPSKEMDLMVLSGKLEYSLSAFTVAELGEMLPSGYHSWIGNMENEKGEWICVEFSEPEFEFGDNCQQANTEANVRAKMLIYLIENKLIEL